MFLCILWSPRCASGRFFSVAMTAGENETKTVFIHDSSLSYQLHYNKNMY